MSKDNLPEQNRGNEEEIDLGVLFNAFGRFFSRLYGFFEAILKAILLVFILPLKLMIRHYKLVFGALLLTLILGFVADNYKKQLYKSQIIVKPFFDSKYEIVNSIDYYNSLISDQNHQRISDIFGVSEDYAESLVRFEIRNGPETETEKRLEYEEFIMEIDSLRALDIPFEKYDSSRDVYSYNSYRIQVLSSEQAGFTSLEKGLNKSFKSPYAVRQKEKQDSLLVIDKNRILNSLKRIDSLQEIYKQVLKEPSTEDVAGFTVKDGLILQEKTKTNEIELIKQETELRRQLSLIDSEIVETSDYFEVLSGFQDVGVVYKPVTTKYKFIFPTLVLVGFFLFYYVRRAINFIKEY